VLIDDRDERPGREVQGRGPRRHSRSGSPIGDKALAEGAVEFKPRKSAGKGDLVPIAEAVARCIATLEA
jgi:hypothetical protein